MENHGENELIYKVQEGSLRISDAFPFQDDQFYLPRPAGMHPTKTDVDLDPSIRKRLKELKWIPAEKLGSWLAGSVSIEELARVFGVVVEQTRVNRRDPIPLPYPVYGFRFFDRCGLYIISCLKTDEDAAWMDSSMQLLSAGGIGGKVSSGWGKYSLEKMEVPDCLQKMLNNLNGYQMLLSTAFPAEQEAEKAMQDANYVLIRRGGFTAGISEKPIKKKTSYLMAAGSTFSSRFDGILYDVATKSPHPVWRYAKALMAGVERR